MNEEKRRLSPPAVGGSSLLVIFAVLCLTVFAMLSMSTVQAEDRLRSAYCEAITDYYKADVEAERILSQLREGYVPDGVEILNNTAAYRCKISDTQNLEVEVILDGKDYKVTRWQAVYAADWVPDDSLNVWTGKES